MDRFRDLTSSLFNQQIGSNGNLPAMRVPRLRLTIRSMIVVVALAAAAVRAVQVSRWWQIKQEIWQVVCALTASHHRDEEMRYQGFRDQRGPQIGPTDRIHRITCAG
jgi:hypothetical protein